MDRFARRPRVVIAVAEIRVQPHAGRRIEADLLPRDPRHAQGDAPPMLRRLPVLLALASLAVSVNAMVADKGLSIGLRQPARRRRR